MRRNPKPIKIRKSIITEKNPLWEISREYIDEVHQDLKGGRLLTTRL